MQHSFRLIHTNFAFADPDSAGWHVLAVLRLSMAAILKDHAHAEYRLGMPQETTQNHSKPLETEPDSMIPADDPNPAGGLERRDAATDPARSPRSVDIRTRGGGKYMTRSECDAQFTTVRGSQAMVGFCGARNGRATASLQGMGREAPGTGNRTG
jgi:hypothetical protein